MLRKLAPFTAAVALGALSLAGGASAEKPAGAPDTACLHAGMAVLQDNGVDADSLRRRLLRPQRGAA